MSIEIEKKYRLKEGDRERLTSALAELGAVYVGQDLEENTIFYGEGQPDRAGIVRIRKVGDRTLLTFKRRLESRSDLKEQIEYETLVSDADQTAAILNELGLHPRLVYEKKRDTWKLRSVDVVLDELSFGDFMEIEGPRTGIKEAEMLLGVDDLEAEAETYPRLTARYGQKVEGKIEARFSQVAS